MAAEGAYGRGHGEAVKALLRMPPWSQLTDQMGAFGRDPNATMDCGEECLAMLMLSTRGIEVPAGYVRWIMGVPDGQGTSPGGLQGFLRREGYESALVRWPLVEHAWQALKLRASEGRLSIMLGRWIIPSEGHWGIPLQLGDSSMLWADPWTGRHQVMERAFFESRFAGVFVQVDTQARYPRPGTAWYRP